MYCVHEWNWCCWRLRWSGGDAAAPHATCNDGRRGLIRKLRDPGIKVRQASEVQGAGEDTKPAGIHWRMGCDPQPSHVGKLKTPALAGKQFKDVVCARHEWEDDGYHQRREKTFWENEILKVYWHFFFLQDQFNRVISQPDWAASALLRHLSLLDFSTPLCCS